MKVWPIELNNGSRSLYSYLCQPNQGRGSFLPKKAKEIKGLVPKLHYKQLTEGQSVTLEDGTVVQPNQVCEEPAPSQCFLFVFIDDESFKESMVNSLPTTILKDFTQ